MIKLISRTPGAFPSGAKARRGKENIIIPHVLLPAFSLFCL
tara:strand:+ start:1620 stop:1742 length:123 start_codon:yes stop_codon:yes gene_type:complete